MENENNGVDYISAMQNLMGGSQTKNTLLQDAINQSATSYTEQGSNTTAVNYVSIPNTTTSGNSALVTSGGTGYWYDGIWYPYALGTAMTTTSSPFMTIDKVENGYIVTKNYKKYIAKTSADVLKFLEEDEKKTKKA